MEQADFTDYEYVFITALMRDREVVVPLIEADSFMESGDKTAEFVQELIKKCGIEKIGTDIVVGNGRYTHEEGSHYWVRCMGMS